MRTVSQIEKGMFLSLTFLLSISQNDGGSGLKADGGECVEDIRLSLLCRGTHA